MGAGESLEPAGVWDSAARPSRQVPDTVYLWPTVAFATASVLNLLSLAFERRSSKMQVRRTGSMAVVRPALPVLCTTRTTHTIHTSQAPRSVHCCWPLLPSHAVQLVSATPFPTSSSLPSAVAPPATANFCPHFSHPPQLCFMATYISAVAFLFEFLAWARLAPIVVTAGGRPLSLMRYIMWLHATPAMLYALSMMSDFSAQRVARLIAVDVVMIVTVIPGELVPGVCGCGVGCVCGVCGVGVGVGVGKMRQPGCAGVF